MQYRLKSNFQYVWPNLVFALIGFVAFVGSIYALPAAEGGEFVVCVLFGLLLFGIACLGSRF